MRLIVPVVPFEAALRFQGPREGCAFKLGVLGLGYYADYHGGTLRAMVRQGRAMALTCKAFHEAAAPVLCDLRRLAARDVLDFASRSAKCLVGVQVARPPGPWGPGPFESLQATMQASATLQTALDAASAAGILDKDGAVVAGEQVQVGLVTTVEFWQTRAAAQGHSPTSIARGHLGHLMAQASARAAARHKTVLPMDMPARGGYMF